MAVSGAEAALLFHSNSWIWQTKVIIRRQLRFKLAKWRHCSCPFASRRVASRRGRFRFRFRFRRLEKPPTIAFGHLADLSNALSCFQNKNNDWFLTYFPLLPLFSFPFRCSRSSAVGFVYTSSLIWPIIISLSISISLPLHCNCESLPQIYLFFHSNKSRIEIVSPKLEWEGERLFVLFYWFHKHETTARAEFNITSFVFWSRFLSCCC